jgi:dTDP-4-amino-4,6-dideoxygalactose transaminase
LQKVNSYPKRNPDFLRFAGPVLSDDEIQEVIKCLESGWLATGPRVAQFEEELSRYCGAAHALAVTSATGGLWMAMKALGVGPGDEVITTPMTFAATANVIEVVGAKAIFVDIDPKTYNIDVTALERSITSRTKVIMPVHFYGIPVDLDVVYGVAEKHKLWVVEDAAHAIGAHYKGRPIGSFGHIQVFSFHPNKNITSGEGGCVTTSDPDLARRLAQWRFHGIDRTNWNRHQKGGSQHYDVVCPGLKFNMTDIQAAIGIHQLRKLDSFIEQRTLLANHYKALLSDCPHIQLPSLPDYDHRHGWHQFGICIIHETLTRDDVMGLLQDQGIGTGLQYTPLHLYSYYRDKYCYVPRHFPHASWVGSRIMSLPLTVDMTIDDVEHVVTALKNILKS